MTDEPTNGKPSKAERSQAAAALARCRTGIQERPSRKKKLAALANLKKARRVWKRMDPEDRKHANPFESSL